MSAHTTKKVAQYDTTLTPKQWELRNRAAKHLLSKKATEISRLESIGNIAKALNSDASSMRRVLEKAPGFVLVRHAGPTGLRTMGVYYNLQFLTWAVELDPSHCYPQNLFELSKGILTRGIEVPMEIVLDNPADIRPGAVAVPDAGIAAVFNEAGLPPEDMVHVPVASAAGITYEDAVARYSAGTLTPEQFIAHFVSRYWKIKQQEEIS